MAPRQPQHRQQMQVINVEPKRAMSHMKVPPAPPAAASPDPTETSEHSTISVGRKACHHYATNTNVRDACRQMVPADDCSMKQARKQVAFCTSVRARLVPGLDDYSDEMTQQLWYNKHDLRQMKESDTQLLKDIAASRQQQDQPCDGSCSVDSTLMATSTIRGLESRVSRVAEKKQKSRQAALRVVMSEQELQQGLLGDENDAARIARSYQQATRHCQAAAYRVARIDAREAMKGW